MNKLQLNLFAFISAWVLAEAITPGIGHEGKLHAGLFALFATVMVTGVYNDFIKLLYWWRR